MKTLTSALVLTLGLFAAGESKAQDLGFDGCYALFVPGGDRGAICLSGTAEEGINGSGVRLSVFDSGEMTQCFRSTASGMTRDSFTFILKGKDLLTFRNIVRKNGKLRGEAVVGKELVNFAQLDPSTTRYLRRASAGKCD